MILINVSFLNHRLIYFRFSIKSPRTQVNEKIDSRGISKKLVIHLTIYRKKNWWVQDKKNALLILGNDYLRIK